MIYTHTEWLRIYTQKNDTRVRRQYRLTAYWFLLGLMSLPYFENISSRSRRTQLFVTQLSAVYHSSQWRHWGTDLPGLHPP